MRTVLRGVGAAIIASSVALLSVAAITAGEAAATQPDPNHKVTICHRTNSTTHPYVRETVDEAAVDMNTGNDNGKGDHNAEHNGPVFDPQNPPPPPHNGDQWGDIIPPFYADGVTQGTWPSKNWSEDGQAIFYAKCKIPDEPTPTESTETSTPSESTSTSTPSESTTSAVPSTTSAAPSPLCTEPNENPAEPCPTVDHSSTPTVTAPESTSSVQTPSYSELGGCPVPLTNGQCILPQTGSRAGLWAGLGALLAAAGGLILLLTRRQGAHL